MHERSSIRRGRMSAGTVALSLGLCLCAGQLVATPAASAAATAAAPATAVQAAAAAAVKPRISTSVNSRSIGWGSKVRVTAKLNDPKTGKVVTTGYVRLQGYRNGKWTTWQTKKVGRTGTVVFLSAPKVTGNVRAYYTGAGQYRETGSAAIKVTVRANGAKIIAEAKRHKGALYKYGASGPKRFDCSGFTKYVYKKAAGKSLPHKANSQQRYGKSVAKSKKQVGDLIVFRSGSHGYHTGIYAGGGYMYDSPHSGARVSKRKMFSSNYVVRRLV